MGDIFSIIVGSVLVKNILLAQFLGVCAFLGVSQKLESTIGMSAAVAFVMFMASAMTWLVRNCILVPFHIEYLQTIAFILVIASLVQFVEMFVHKFSPALYDSLGIYLPLITTNCAVLGVAIMNVNAQYSFVEAVVNGLANAAGFALALILFAGIRERLEEGDVPKALQGAPIAFVSAGIMAIAFLGFSGLL
ncbi:MAG TPA: electron transport complex subunit RsxA [Clostridia bacterium]|nr:electron transport complex subunit RsxA [Clostridia bacterium]